MITLTVKEIRDLAEFAGIVLDKEIEQDADELETEITITWEPTSVVNDDGKAEVFAHVAHFAEYPEEGCCPLGEPIAA